MPTSQRPKQQLDYKPDIGSLLPDLDGDVLTINGSRLQLACKADSLVSLKQSPKLQKNERTKSTSPLSPIRRVIDRTEMINSDLEEHTF